MTMTQTAPRSGATGEGAHRAHGAPFMPLNPPWSAGEPFRQDHGNFQVGQNLLANSLSARLRLSSGTRTAPSNASPTRRESRAPLSRPGKVPPSQVETLVDQEAVKRKDYTREWAQNLQEPTNVLPVALPSDTLPRLEDGSTSEKCPNQGPATRTLYFADGSFASHPLYPMVGINSPENRNYIKMVKRSGVFQPLDKYATPRPRYNSRRQSTSARDSEYELLTFPLSDDYEMDDGQGDRKRKGLKVSWSRTAHTAKLPVLEHRKNSAHSGTSDASDKRSTSTSTIQKPLFVTRKQKVDGVGVKWRLPLGYDNQHPLHKRAKSGGVSRDLHPVTSGMEREGTSVTKTRWQVASSMGSVDTSRSWLDTLESIKRSPSLYKDMTSRSGSHHHDVMSSPTKSPGGDSVACPRHVRLGSCS